MTILKIKEETKINKYYLYADIKQDRNVKYDKPERKKAKVCKNCGQKVE